MWIFEQATGRLLDSSGNHIATGYSGGNCGNNPDAVNNPDRQDQHLIGPLPQGLYAFGPILQQSHLGPFAIPLIPDSSNEMFGRSSFYIHGDNSNGDNSASEGCIILPRTIRNSIWDSDDHSINVIRG